MSIDESTEEKIKESARAIFMRKGYAATKTRDIAEEAGINLALVNYYFRSKEKLFQQIMNESLQDFFASILKIFFDEKTSLEDKLSQLASGYIDLLMVQPEMPLFILSELRANPHEFVSRTSANAKLKESVLFRQIVERVGPERMLELNPVHIMMNLMGLIVFPFLGRPMLEITAEINDEKFRLLMEQRKKLIPVWIMQMIS